MNGTRISISLAAAALVAAGGIYLLAGRSDAPAATSQPAKSADRASRKRSRSGKRLRISWKKDRGTRVAEGSVPFIHKLRSGAGARYRLYFCGREGIMSAVSNNGLDFTTEPGTRLAPSAEAGSQESAVCDPSLVNLPGGRVRMYYKGSNGPGGPGQALHKIFSAVSSDGLAFTREGLRIDSERTDDRGWASVPEAVKLPGGRVRLYYVSGDSKARGGTMSAISRDGLTFRKERRARAKGLVDPAVIRVAKNRYLMLAVVLPPPPGTRRKRSLREGIYSLTSSDGLRFRNRRPVLLERGVYDPTVVRLSRKRFRVYYGKDTSSVAEQPRVVTRSLTGRMR